MSVSALRVCGKCGFRDDGESAHCEECGAKLRERCTACGAIALGQPKHCRDCGAPLNAVRADMPQIRTPEYLSKRFVPARARGERKIATILRADIVNSAETTRGLDPEDVKRILFPMLEIMAGAVHRYEGIVVRHEGDAIVASFGAPVALEEHAVRACYAALDMQAAIRNHSIRVSRELGAPLEARVGIDSGIVVYTTDQKTGHEVLERLDGVALNIVARIEPLATPGEILLSAGTLALAEGYIQVRAMGSRALKGLDPVQIYHLDGVITRKRIQASAARGQTRFVGREHEIDTLRRAAAATLGGCGQLLALVGEAGVGKSRIFQEFIYSSEMAGWHVLEAGSASYGTATSYFSLVDLLTRYFDIQRQDDEHRVREKVIEKLSVSLKDNLLAQTPFYLGALGVAVNNDAWLNLPPVERQSKMFAAVKDLLIRESLRQPLCLVFEDLHWVDAESLAFLEILRESSNDATILLLVNYRADHQSKPLRNITELRIDPLPAASAGELLDGLIGSRAELGPIKQALMNTTEGNPLFLEESVRSLIESGVLVGEPGQLRLRGSLPPGFVPKTIQALLAARIDRLRPETKEMLQCAAVIGTDVPRALLEAMAGVPQSEIERGTRELLSADFLYEKTLFPEIAYAFRHAMTREVAYAGLLREQKTALHARAADAMIALADGRIDEYVERIALHAEQGGMWPVALDYLDRAGTKAFALYANVKAAGFFEQAINILRHLPENRTTLEKAVDLRFKVRNALIPVCELDRVSQTLNEIEPLLAKLGDKARSARLAGFRCNHHFLAGEQRRAIEIGDTGLRLARDCGDAIIQGELLYRIGQSYHALGENGLAVALLQKSLEFASDPRGPNRFELSIILAVVKRTWLTFALSECGEFRTGLDHAKRALGIAEKSEHPLSQVLGWLAIGHVLQRKGELDGAIGCMERGLLLCDSYSLPIWRFRLLSSLGAAYACCGQLSNGIDLAEQALAGAERLKLIVDQPLFLVNLAQASMLANRPEAALTYGNRALEIALAHEGKGHEAWARFAIARAAWVAAPASTHKPAHELETALRLATECGEQPLAAFCQTTLGDIHRRRGDKALAKKFTAAADAIYLNLDMRPLLLDPVR
jgi:class 3 adenylate cyclase/tetratricopeptide (TPR) repeat protein